MIECSKDKSINVTYIEAPIDKVWWAVSTPEGNNSYLTYEATTSGSSSQPKVGDKLKLCYGDIVNHTEITKCEYQKLFSLKDAYESIAPDGTADFFHVETEFLLEQEGAFVKLTITVSGFEEDTYGQWFRECLEMGWRRSLMNLKSVLELGMDLRNELFSYPRLGVVNCTVDEEISQKTGANYRQGNYLLEVFPNSPAAEAGLKKGDVILSFDEKPTNTYADFVRVISTYYNKPSTVTISFLRDKKKSTVKTKLSTEDVFTGLVELEGTTLEEVKEKREILAKQRSASGSLWSEK